MRGGKLELFLAARSGGCFRAALVGLLVAGSGFTGWADVATAEEARYSREQFVAAQPIKERSILVAKELASDGAEDVDVDEEDPFAFEDSPTSETLEPIARLSPHVPDLAEPGSAEPGSTNKEPLVDDRLEEFQSDVYSPQELQHNEPVTFHGITPGVSVRSDVLDDWGTPVSTNGKSTSLSYDFEGLDRVEVQFAGDRVSKIVVTLDTGLPLAEMEASMQLGSSRPIAWGQDAQKRRLECYPERGVVLAITEEAAHAVPSDQEAAPEQTLVKRVEIGVVSPTAFLKRAEASGCLNISATIADLETVATMESTSVEARRLLSYYNLLIGKAITAERYAAEAVELAPNDAGCRLQWIKCLRALAQYDRAVEQARTVMGNNQLQPLDRAEAYEELAQLAALGSKKISDQVIPLHSKTIEIADGQANSSNADLRHRAQVLLIDAHLGIANQIAQGNFQDKTKAVTQWVERASALSEALISEDASFLPLRLKIAVSALSAATSLDKPIDPQLWIEEAEETVGYIESDISDRITCGQYDWQLGLAYLYAADIEHVRSKVFLAKKYGALAEEKLGEIARQRDELPDTAYTMGRLYFQIGAVYAVHEENHQSACKWYNQAAELLLNPVPVTTVAVPQQHGDALVSMGVSYWYTDERDRAVELTLAGVKLIEQAVESGMLSSQALSIPYENLSAMYSALGEEEPAQRYQSLARKASGTGEGESQRK